MYCTSCSSISRLDCHGFDLIQAIIKLRYTPSLVSLNTAATGLNTAYICLIVYLVVARIENLHNAQCFSMWCNLRGSFRLSYFTVIQVFVNCKKYEFTFFAKWVCYTMIYKTEQKVKQLAYLHFEVVGLNRLHSVLRTVFRSYKYVVGTHI